MDVNVFKRVEKKYLLTETEYRTLMKQLDEFIEPDSFSHSTVCNIYFDTDDYLLVRRSNEKPVYKEKVRLRSYGIPDSDTKVFLEIKKKYNGVVGKRRISAPLKEIYNYLETGKYPKCDKQIMNEIDYCFKMYQLHPKVFLAYDRTSYRGKSDHNFRLTFDKNVRSRFDDLHLEFGDAGKLLLNKKYIMEVKTLGAYPLWFSSILSSLKIYPSSFSKYGNVYKREILKKKVW